MEAFIREFRTTNELLLKERNNSLSELKFEVYGLSRAIEKAQIANCEIKGVTTRGGKTTTKTTHNTNIANEPPAPDHDKSATPCRQRHRLQSYETYLRLLELGLRTLSSELRMHRIDWSSVSVDGFMTKHTLGDLRIILAFRQ
ncbi:hypothetical protein Tco_0205166 [Tanacetum coccineum]